MEKTCTKCKCVKNTENDFGRSGKTKHGWQDWCKECRREYDRAYYQSNSSNRKQQVRDYTEQQRIKVIALLADYKKAGCSKCPEADPRCMDFHHLRDKEFNIADAVHGGYSESRVIEEVNKCIVLCANCHRKLHGAVA